MRGRSPVRLVVLPHAEASEGFAERLGPSDRARLAGADDRARARLLAGRQAALEATTLLLGADGRHAPLVIDATCPTCGGAHGRPVVSSAGRAVHVSIAHASGRAFAVAGLVPVGVDAEPRTTPRARLAAVAAVTGRPARNPLATWTRLEAVLKADGRGLLVDPRDVVGGPLRTRVRDRETAYRVRVRRLDDCVVAIARADGWPPPTS